MSIQMMIQIYGYPVVLLGAAIEGETVLVIASFLAHRGYLDLLWVFIFAFLGSFGADQLFFQLGRRKGAAILVRKPAWRPRADRVYKFLNRYHIAAIIGFRFIYGFRTITPFALGMTSLGAWRFVILNAAGALTWVIIMGSLGYLFGRVITSAVHDARKYELGIVLAITAVGLFISLYRRRKNRD